jgi:hypothetical protein
VVVKTVVYTFESPATVALASRLAATGRISAIILQRPMTTAAKVALLRRRLSKFGVARVADELLFQIYYRLFLRSKDNRLRQCLGIRGSETRAALPPGVDVFDVASINSAESRSLLTRLAPDLVVMASRELIRPDVLALARIGFVGCHPGILPDYRGAYASFWAMREGRKDKVGVSVYLASAGIDTGPLVAERAIAPQFGVQHFKVESERLILEGARELIEAMDRAERGGLETYTKPDPPGPLYSLVALSDFLQAVRR